jgi:hypothetical protein
MIVLSAAPPALLAGRRFVRHHGPRPSARPSAARAFEGVFVSLSVPAASPQRPTVTARVRFANLKAGYSASARSSGIKTACPSARTETYPDARGRGRVPRYDGLLRRDAQDRRDRLQALLGQREVYTETDMELKSFSKRFYARLKASSDPYAISVVRSQIVVLVYALGEDGSTPFCRTRFSARPGRATPTGTYSLSDRYPWRARS